MPSCNIITTSKLEELAKTVDSYISRDLLFFKYGNRLTQIKRYLIENDFNIPQAIASIKRTSKWRENWNADTIIASDVMDICSHIVITPYGLTDKGQLATSIYFDDMDSMEFDIQSILICLIYHLDRLLMLSYKENYENNQMPPLKNYIFLIIDGTSFSNCYKKFTNPLVYRTILDVIKAHYPCMFDWSLNYICDQNFFEPPVFPDCVTILINNASNVLRLMYVIWIQFYSKPFIDQVLVTKSNYLPDFIPKDIIYKEFGGTKLCNLREWFFMNAYTESCEMKISTQHSISPTALLEFGTGREVKACDMPGCIAKGWFWKMTNTGHKWNHYYFILIKEHILYYYSDENDITIHNAILLSGCKIIISTNPVDKRREGSNSICSIKYSLQTTTAPCYSDEENPNGNPHNYHFVLRTPSRDFIFGCNDIEQRAMWLYYLKKSIEACKV
ncbi:hypothetical protein WA158_008475 [Blastocystis sp. Blastoise]